MIYSMTGFGSARAEADKPDVLVEIKSVNHRYIDIHIKIPGEFQSLETQVRQRISSAFKRGRFDAFVRVDYKAENVKLDANLGMIRAYADLMKQLKKDFPIQGELTMDMLSRVPGMIAVSGTDLLPEVMERIGSKLGEAAGEAVRKLLEMRVIEGKSLMSDIDRRLGNIADPLENDPCRSPGFRRPLPAAVGGPCHGTGAATCCRKRAPAGNRSLAVCRTCGHYRRDDTASEPPGSVRRAQESEG
jgi:uncharacterized protein (TIGR00255 family)